MTKKSLTKPNKQALSAAISHYQSQAKSFLAIYKKRKKKHVRKMRSGLINLMPFAAASLIPVAVQAQPCPGSPAGANASTVGCMPQTTKVDVDGGGFDLVFEHVLGLRVLGVAGESVTFSRYFNLPYAYINAYAASATIDATSGNFGSLRTTGISGCGETAEQYGWLDYDALGNGGWNGVTGSRYLGFVKGGRVGYIEVIYNDAANTFSIGEFGIANDGSITSISAGDCSSLPIELARFYGERVDGGYLIQWKTASELNNAGFEIQRSIDGEDYRKIGWIEGMGTTSEGQDYRYEDTSLQPGTIYYYRLKQVDFDGSFSYSTVIRYEHALEGAFRIQEIFPNPVSGDYLDLEITTPEDKSATILVYDAMGRSYLSTDEMLHKGQQTVRVDLPTVAAGAYFLQVKLDNGESHFRKFQLIR